MFANKLLLKAVEHGDIKVSETRDWAFAADEVIVPVVYSEMADAAREYPLVFVKDRPLLYALTGIETDINAYVSADGRWQATYIPAQLRAYPFAFFPVAQKPGEFVLALDPDAPQLVADVGSILFQNGQPTPFLKQRIDLLQQIQKARPVTEAMVKAIEGAGLLVERSIGVRRADGRTLAIKGIRVIDEKALNAMSHEAFARLRDLGALPLVYAHLFSMANLRLGPLAGKYPQLASPGSKPAAAAEAPLAKFGDDIISFN